MTKEEQREKLLKIRDSLSVQEIEQKSSKIKEKLFDTQEFKSAETVLIYIDFRNEVQTKEVIKEILTGSKRVIVPIMGEKRLYLSELRDFETELEKSRYGILEPQDRYQRLVKAEELDLIIAPGVGFDEQGNRMGYGGGYYDRLLASIPKVPVLALSFAEQIVEQIKVSAHDQQVDKVITDKRIIDSQKS
ncbi:MAG: 5-formyltetrahydrofolate cyclo-ligase [Halanaerobacter sp.]